MHKALGLIRDLAEAHYVLGRIYWSPPSHFLHERAIEEYQQALRSNPDLSEAHTWLGIVYQHIGLFDNSLQEFQRAIDLNPSNTAAYQGRGNSDVFALRYREAVNDLRGIQDSASPSMQGYDMAWAQFGLGQRQEAAYTLKRFLAIQKGKDTGGVLHSMQAVLFASAGARSKALKEIRAAKEAGKDFGHFHHAEYTIASAYALIGDKKRAIEALQNSAADGFPCYPLFRDDPNLKSLRKDVRFKAFMAQQETQWLAFNKRHPTPL